LITFYEKNISNTILGFLQFAQMMIQCLKALSTSAPHPRNAFPAKFFLVTDILESFVSLVASRYKCLPHPWETFPAKFFLVTDILESFVSPVASRYKLKPHPRDTFPAIFFLVMDILESFVSLMASSYKLTSQLRYSIPAKFFLVTDILESFISLMASRYKYLSLIHVVFSRQILPGNEHHGELRLPCGLQVKIFTPHPSDTFPPNFSW
jgi:hypothetical protein